MTSADLTDLATQLATARKTGSLIDVEPFSQLQTVNEAYTVQALATDQYEPASSGYKIGATSQEAQKIIGCEGPFYGPMFSQDSFQSNNNSLLELELKPGTLGTEAEFAFRIGEDFPSHENLIVADLPALIADCCIAIEVIGRRTRASGLPPLLLAISDFGANTSFIAGPSVPHWTDLDLANIAVTAHIDGQQTNVGSSSAVMGNPLRALLWLHKTLQMNQGGLKAQDWVSTGTCLGVIEARKGSLTRVSFENCGQIEYRFK